MRAGFTADRVSRFYATPCFPPGAGPDYVNAAATLHTPPGMEPAHVLAVLQAVELLHGRERRRRWGMRTLDLDLIACGDKVIPDRDIQTQVAQHGCGASGPGDS